jgi:hypothetical protein
LGTSATGGKLLLPLSTVLSVIRLAPSFIIPLNSVSVMGFSIIADYDEVSARSPDDYDTTVCSSIMNAMKLNITNKKLQPLDNVFKSTAATYKFYWFLAILELINERANTQPINNRSSITISFADLSYKMIANAFYAVKRYRINFGQSDSLQQIVESLSTRFNMVNNGKISREYWTTTAIEALLTANADDKDVVQAVDLLSRYVPYRFLTAWIKLSPMPDGKKNAALEKQSQQLAEELGYQCIYWIDGQEITVDSVYIDFMLDHFVELRDFIYWNLLVFLQSKNPNTPALAYKILPPDPNRESLIKQHRFFDILFTNGYKSKCIYSGIYIDPDEYALDHFLPYSYVAHNLLFNLIPVSQSLNSSKSNYLPDLDTFLPKLAAEHRTIFQFAHSLKSEATILEDYLILGSSYLQMEQASDEYFATIYRSYFSPAYDIALSQGFEKWSRPKCTILRQP